MSNAFLIWSLLYIFIPQLALAGPRSMVSLSPQVAKIVPHCAQQCLKSFIAHNFPRNVCRNQQHLDCLCSRKSVSGLTLGEGALQCAASVCSFEVLQESKVDVYELCEDVSSARPMTYGTLTATRAYVSTITSSTSSHIHTMTTTDSSLSPLPTPSSITAPSSGLLTPTLPTSIAIAPTWPSTLSSLETFSSISSSPTHPIPSSTNVLASPASSSPAPATRPALTKSQVAGITVAGVASAALAFGLLFCIFCLRRRKSGKRRSGSSFGGDKVIETRSGSPGLPPTGVQDHQITHRPNNFSASEQQQPNTTRSADDRTRWSLLRRNTRPEDIGVAVAHVTDLEPSHDDTLASTASHRTTSQLLPDKPTYSLFPPRQPQLRVVNPGNSPVSPQSPDSFNTLSPISADIGRSYKPAPRGRNALDTSQAHLQQENKVVHTSTSDPFLDSPKDAEGLIYAGEMASTRPKVWRRSLDTTRKPIPVQQLHGNTTPHPTKDRSHALQIRDPSVYVGRPVFGVSSEQNRSAEQALRSNAKRKNSNKRPSTVFSTFSETSFEDAGDEDDEPAYPFLSPVTESPEMRPPHGRMIDAKVQGTVAGSAYLRRPSPESPTPRPPPRNPLRAVIAQQRCRSGDFPQPDVAELPGSPVTSSVSPLARRNVNSQAPDSPRSAKWQILVGSGHEGIENAGLTSSQRRTEPTTRSG